MKGLACPRMDSFVLQDDLLPLKGISLSFRAVYSPKGIVYPSKGKICPSG